MRARDWAGTVMVTALVGASAFLRGTVAVPILLAVASACAVFVVYDVVTDWKRRRARTHADRPRIDMGAFRAMQEDANRFRPREGWIATCKPEEGWASGGGDRMGTGVRLHVRGPDGDPFSLFRCEVLGPQGNRLAEYQNTDPDSGDFLPSIHPRSEHSVRWPDQFTPPVPDPVPSGDYWVGWVGESGGRWLFLASATFAVTPEGEYR